MPNALPNEMPQSTFDLEKMIKPVTRSSDSLKRVKEPGLKRELSDIYKAVGKVESAAEAVSNFKSVADAKSYEKKVGLVKDLVEACEAAGKAVTDLLGQQVRASGSPRKGRAIEVQSALPSRVSDPTVENVPGVGDQLKELNAKIAAAVKDTKDVQKDLTAWLKSELKDGKLSVKIPRGVTNMIELVDSKGKIALPKDQCFDVTITYKFEKAFQPDDSVFSKELEEEIMKALLPSKQAVAQKFRVWNSGYAEIEKEFDRKKAEDLFEAINKYFDNDIQKQIEDDLKEAARKALSDTLSRAKVSESVAKDAKIDAKPNFSNFAIFKIKFPDNPADKVSSSIGKKFDSMEAAQKGYADAVKEIGKNYESLAEAIKELQKELKAGSRKGGGGESDFDSDKMLKAFSKSTSDLESALKDAENSSDALLKQLEPVKKKVDDSKNALKGNASAAKSIDELSKSLKAAGDQLKDKIPKRLKDLSKSVTEAKEIEKTVSKLGGDDPPAPEKLNDAADLVDKQAKAFSTKRAEIEGSLALATDVDQLRSLADNLKS